MKHLHIILSILFLLPPISLELHSQEQMAAISFMPHIGDSLCKREIVFFTSNETGENQIWDFRDIEDLDNNHSVFYYCDSDSVMLYALEERKLFKYPISTDTLMTKGYETSLHSMSYDSPINLLIFPCSYGDHIVQPFHGIGSYCKKYVLETTGTLETEIDATGTIYLNDIDTLYHVIRQHQIYSSAITQYLPTDTLIDTLNVKQRIEERYLWYARGYRYPVFETESITILNDLVPVSCQQRAFCTLPSDQLELDDEINQQILAADALEQGQTAQPTVMTYDIAVNGNDIQITYTLQADATINALICDRLGMVYKRATQSGYAGEPNAMHINCNGLHHGVYVLYMNVNGNIFTEKINLQQ